MTDIDKPLFDVSPLHEKANRLFGAVPYTEEHRQRDCETHAVLGDPELQQSVRDMSIDMGFDLPAEIERSSMDKAMDTWAKRNCGMKPGS